MYWRDFYVPIFNYIRYGKKSFIEDYECLQDSIIFDKLDEYRKKYKDKEYFSKPRFDKVAVTTLFTFYWDITIETINFVKKLCKTQEDVLVGGIMSTLLPKEVFEATGIKPIEGLLNKRGQIDKNNKVIIDELPLDYSILEEIDYVYPTHDAYFAYTTRGCVNKCPFCAVPILEPKYCDYISLKEEIEKTKKRFGEQRNLMCLEEVHSIFGCRNQCWPSFV